MRYPLLILVFFWNSILIGQNIVTDASMYTVQELVEDVLINSNCLGNVQVTSFGGPSFSGGDLSYGYFDSNGADFPFTSGIVLTTGRLSEVPGPNISAGGNSGVLRAGTNDGLRDYDLENAIGISNTHNTTYIEFEFTAQTNHISFNYLFASEQYLSTITSTNQCSFTDGFAFLIKESGSVDPYENLAVIPGTNTPLNTTNVRGQGPCPAQNEEYFDSFNGYDHPIAYNGQTKVLTAQTNVVPGVRYTIKLAIADQGNAYYDSAVFIQAGSFNVIDLGSDRTFSSNNPLCEEDSLLLDVSGSNASVYEWFMDGVSQEINTIGTFLVTQPGTYSVVATINGCLATDDIHIEYDSFVVNNATITQCDPDGDGYTEFNLFDANSIITQGLQGVQVVGFYTTQTDAENTTNAIANATNFINTSVNQIVYARTENRYRCSSLAKISLVTVTNTIDTVILDTCDDKDGYIDGFTSFNLKDADIPLTQTIPNWEEVTYFLTELEAIQHLNRLPDFYTNVQQYTQVIYARIDTADGCFGITTVTLNVHVPPVLEPNSQVYYCTDTYPGNIELQAGVIGNPSEYDYLWSNGDTTYSTYVNRAGIYTVTITDRNSGCSDSRSIEVFDSSIANISVSISGNVGNYTVTINTIGDGVYTFAMDDTSRPFTSENVFVGLASGQHTIYVRDENGCGISSKQFYLIDFPKFFTPNADGYNDYWQVLGHDAMIPQVKTIFIFDRLGKLIKEIHPDSEGWDGTYIGSPLPSSDYWFKAILIDNSIYHGHFTLNR